MDLDLTTPVDKVFVGESAFPQSPVKQMSDFDELEETMPMGAGFARSLFASGEITAPPLLNPPCSPRKRFEGGLRQMSVSCPTTPYKTPSKCGTPKHRRVLSVDIEEQQQRINPFSPSGVPQGLDDPRASPMTIPTLSPVSTFGSHPKQPHSRRMDAFKLWSQESVSITPGSRRRSRRGSEDLAHPMLPTTEDTDDDSNTCLSNIGIGLQYSKQQATVYSDSNSTVWRVAKKLDGMLACITIVKEPVTPDNEDRLLCQVKALLALQNNGIGYQDCWKERLIKNGESFQRLYILTDSMFTFESVAINGVTEEMVISMADSVYEQIQTLHKNNLVHGSVSLNSIVATSGKTVSGTAEFKLGLFSTASETCDSNHRRLDYFLLGVTILEALGDLPVELTDMRRMINVSNLQQFVSFASSLNLRFIQSDRLRSMLSVLLSIDESIMSLSTHHHPTEYEALLRCNLQQLESELRTRQLQNLFPLHRHGTIPLIQLTQGSPPIMA